MIRCVYAGLSMFYPESNEPKQKTETNEDQRLLLDGTVNPEYSEDDAAPRVRGLIELINQYFRNKPDQNL